MFFLGLLIAICYVPGYTGASIPTQWVALSCLLPLSLWQTGWVTSLHKLGIVFLLYMVIAISWAISPYSAVLAIWQTLILALAFWYGSVKPYLLPLWKGLAIGIGISSLVAYAQTFGLAKVETFPGSWAGLYFNSAFLGASCALIIIACASHRLWYYIPLPAIGLACSFSRGAILIVVLSAIAKYVHWLVALALLIAGALVFSFLLDPSDSDRLKIWGYAIRGLTTFGWGPGSFNDVFYFSGNHSYGQTGLLHAEFAHNEYLQLWFEYGIGAIPIYGIFAMALSRTNSAEWPIVFGFAILAMFYSPLHTPLPAFIGTVAAGNILRRYDPIRDLRERWRSYFLSRSAATRLVSANRGGASVSLFP